LKGEHVRGKTLAKIVKQLAGCALRTNKESVGHSVMTTFAVTSVNSLLGQVSTCFRIGSELRCIRSTPTEMQSISENDFECFANTGVNTPATMLPN